MDEIILHAMERDPAKRYESAAAMKSELDDYEKVELIGRHHHLQAPQAWKSRFRLLPIILGFLVLQVVGFVLILWYLRHHPK